MFNGMMDPELMRIAQEQMSKIPPSELARMQQQIMSNPELIRMASESMKNMRPEDFKNAAEQLKYARSEDMAEISKKIVDATPEEIAAFSAQADSQVTYALNAAQMLKKQGNELHSQGRFSDAAEKYLHAKKNLKAIPFSKGRSLQLACSLNLMSCYLKTRQCEKCIEEGTEVLKYEAENVKALYRRGQAYKELGMFEDAVSDLSKAHAVSPDDETITAILRIAEEELSKGGGKRSSSKGLVIEEITDEDVETLPQQSKPSSSSSVYSVDERQEARKHLERESDFNVGNMRSVSEPLQGLKNDPEAIRSFQNFISNPDPNTLAALSAGNAEGMPPDMIKNISGIISKMPPEELQRMIHMASSFQGKNPFMHSGSVDSSNSTRSGPLPHDVSPEMLKAASDMMSKMPAEDLQRMFEMASALKGNSSVNDLRSNNRSELSEASEIPAAKMKSEVGESSSSNRITNSRSAAAQSQPSSASAFMNSNNDFQEQMRNQMNDPAMRQMFTSMIKNMSPDMMANMSEQFGIKLSKEDAAKAQQAMSSLSPDDLDRMMRWADRLQRTVEGAKKTKNWLLGKPGLIFAICMLILAMILHRLGFIGS